MRAEIIEPAGLTLTAAGGLKVSRPAVSDCDRQRRLSGDMALRIERPFESGMETMMRMQSSFDIAETRKREGTIH